MSKTVAQIFVTNPTTVVADTDLYYLVQSPYTPGTDAAISGASLKAVFGTGGTINPGLVNQLGFYAASGSTISGLATANNGVLITSAGGVPSISSTLPTVVQDNITRLGTISNIGAPLGSLFGGTGVNNGSSIITLGGSLTTSGAFASTFTMTGITGVTFPTSGTLATTAGTVANATNIGITDDTTTNATMYPLWVTANTGFLPAKVSSTKMTFNPSTGTLISSILGASSISTFVPSTTIESATQAGSNTITSSSYVSSATSGARFIGQHARNTYASPLALANNDIIATFGAQGYGATGFSSSAIAYLKILAAEAFTDTAQGTKITIATTPTGTIVPVDAITISNAGVVAFPVAPLGLTSGGMNASLTASNGGIFYSTASAGAILAGTATAQQLLMSGASTTPQWSTTTYPLTNAISTLLYASATNVISALATANNGLLVTSSTGVPSILAGPGTTGNLLISNAAAAPSFTTFSYPTTVGATGSIHISNGTNIVSSTSLWPNTVGTSRKVVISDGTSNVYSTETYAVPGTSGNVMTSDGTNWISSVPASTSLLTTKGDLFSFSTVDARLPVATGDGKVLQVSSGATTGLAYSTPTYPSASGSAGTILRSDGTNNLYTTSTYPNTNAVSTLLYASSANVMAALATANNGTFITSATGVPSILAGPGTTGNILQSNAAAAPSFSSATYPSSTTINNVLFSSATNVVGQIAAVNGGVLVSNNTGVPSMLANPAAAGKMLQSANAAIPTWSTPTYPSASGANTSVIISDGTNYIASTSLWPNTVGTSGKIVISNGTSNVYSTPTYPNTSPAAGLFIVSDGTNFVASAKPAFTTINIQTFAVNGTYTPTSGMKYCIIECLGSGGAGGGAASSTGFGCGGGGGAGSYSRKFATSATVGVSQTVTVPAGGTAGTAGNNPGNNGADTSVGVICVGKGGTGGGGAAANSSGTGGAGGVAGTGDVTTVGNSGTSGGNATVTTVAAISGIGGSSTFGGQGAALHTQGTGTAATGVGAGGNGGISSATGAGVAGGGGGTGYVIITEYIYA